MAAAQETRRQNGFALQPSTIPVDEILSGGPSRDGIPALNDPRAVPIERARWRDDEMVVGVTLGKQARAYPLAILVWHELVNDELGGQPILVSYCPLCGTALTFDRRIAGKTRRFGVSGLLYQSDLLLYDRESESLWSQISATAVTGSLAGKRLKVLRSSLLTWGAWKREHPQTTVITLDTGHERAYGQQPYGDYATSERLYFPARQDSRYHPKMPTLGLRAQNELARAYPAAELEKAGGSIKEKFAGHDIVVSYDATQQVFDVDAPLNIEVIEGYWFAWTSFHPKTTVFKAPN